MNQWWSWGLTSIGVFGLYLAGKKSPWGWAVGIGAQVIWLAYAITTRQWGFLISSFAYGFVYAKNFRSWRKTSVISEVVSDHVQEVDRNARAYGFEIGRGKPLTKTVDGLSDDNPFLTSTWRNRVESF